MKISDSWLRKYIPLTQSPNEISEALTSVGLEVESMENKVSIKGGLEGLLIGYVKECVQHPNADRLRLTKVDVGADELLSIVCGAANVAAGQKVIVAPVGATVHPTTGESFKINKSKIRGEVSEGMICAEDEIGLGHSHEGIKILEEDAPIGKLYKEYIGLSSETIYEIGLTPNRADAASHMGVARDLAAYFNTPIVLPAIKNIDVMPSAEISIEIEDTNDCPRFAGLLVKNVQVEESPAWLKDALQSIGVKSINNIVDITNFICHGIGQPMHAYDADSFRAKKIGVRRAKANEKYVGIDNVERTMKGNELIISNDDQMLGLAGVMGGSASSVNANTKNVFFESAYFNSVAVRKSAKVHGLKTDASFRFERGTDPSMCVFALNYAMQLLSDMGHRASDANIVDVYPKIITPNEIDFDFQYCRDLIGKNISNEEIEKILNGLDIQTMHSFTGGIRVRVPLAKVDVTRPCDLVEEVLRMYGLNNIEMPAQLRSSLSFTKKPDLDRVQELISEFLSSNGFKEIMSNSLTSEKNNALSSEKDSVRILNPLSIELDVLRNQMISSGLECIAYNINRRSSDLKLYEWGSTYHTAEKNTKEVQHLTLFVSGNQFPEHWQSKSEKHSLFTIKSVQEQIWQRLGMPNIKSQAFSDEHSQGFIGMLGKTEVFRVYSIVKKTLKAYDIAQEVFVADFNWTEICQSLVNTKKKYSEASKYPEVRRDLSMLLDKKVAFEQLKKAAFQAEQRLLKRVDVFDVYEGDKLPAGKKSYALSFILQDEEKTLQDQQIDQVMNKMIQVFEKDWSAEIRKA